MPRNACPFVWYELMTPDAEAAEAFYRSVVGWQTADAAMPGMKYTLLSAGNVPVAGLWALDQAARDAGAQPSWIGYVGVDDVDAMLPRLTAAGGKRYRPAEDIPGVGRFAIVADPHGAPFCLFTGQSGDEPPTPPPPGTPGTIGWHELAAGALDGAWAFYSGLFGWTKDQAFDMGPMGVYQLFCTGGEAVGGMLTKPAELPAPGWLYYFNVPALDAAMDRVSAGGGRVVNGPMEVPGGSWIAQCTDPQGVVFALLAPQR